MATQNFFALLGDEENDDPADLLARAGAVSLVKKVKKQDPKQAPPAKLPTKPSPPAQAVRDSRGEGGRGRGGGRGGGRGIYVNRERESEGAYTRPPREGGPQGNRGDYNDRNYRNGADLRGSRGGFENGNVPAPREDGEGRFSQDGVRGRGRGRGRGSNADGEEHFGRRVYDRRSGSGRGNEIKRDGAGRGNWGVDVDQTTVQEVLEDNIVEEKPVSDATEKKLEEGTEGEAVEKKEVEEEDKEMTLEEYEKVLAERRKVLLSQMLEERKVMIDKDFESMQLVDKKSDDEVLLKLGSDKGKKKEIEKDERSKKSVSINEFLKPAEGESMYGRRGRSGGRGRGDRGGFRGGFGGAYSSREATTAPRIEDPGQFPTLGGK